MTLEEAKMKKLLEIEEKINEYKRLSEMTPDEFFLNKKFISDIEENELEFVIRNSLNIAHYDTVFSVTQVTEKKLLKRCRNLGVNRIKKLKLFLAKHGLSLKEEK